LPAFNGDCLIVSFGKKTKKHILIDCGYPQTYEECLKPILLEISNKGECLERMIITHIDSDHIFGTIKFLEENQSKFIEIKQVWHNTYRHLKFIDAIS